VSSILPKNEHENVNLCPSLVLAQKNFIRFLGELKNKQKSLSKLTDLCYIWVSLDEFW
jgi:hypothetical protein